jgi:hypothetical protein
MSVIPVICENQQCQNVQGDGQRPEGSVILGRSLLLVETVGWKGITDRRVMEGRERERAL